jgi:hypothetical protein
MRRDEASRVAFALPNKSQQRGVDASLRATQLRKRRNSAALQNLADNQSATVLACGLERRCSGALRGWVVLNGSPNGGV